MPVHVVTKAAARNVGEHMGSPLQKQLFQRYNELIGAKGACSPVLV